MAALSWCHFAYKKLETPSLNSKLIISLEIKWLLSKQSNMLEDSSVSPIIQQQEPLPSPKYHKYPFIQKSIIICVWEPLCSTVLKWESTSGKLLVA